MKQFKSLQLILKIAGIYNLIWGAWVVLFPLSFFNLVGMQPPIHITIWQGMGMVIGLYGLGYYLASYDYIRHWPIVAIGLLGKIFGPIGYFFNLYIDNIDPVFGYALITNDFIWWIPFGMMVYQSYVQGFPISGNKSLLKRK